MPAAGAIGLAIVTTQSRKADRQRRLSLTKSIEAEPSLFVFFLLGACYLLSLNIKS